MQITGYTNAVRATAAAVRALGVEIDEESFDRLAQLRGEASPEAIKNGFIVRGYDDIQRLCDIADIVVMMDGESGLVKAYDPAEFVPVEERH